MEVEVEVEVEMEIGRVAQWQQVGRTDNGNAREPRTTRETS
jgi:hypothetical protein